MNISCEATIISGRAFLLLTGYPLYRQPRQAEGRAMAAVAAVEQLRAATDPPRAERAALWERRRRNRRRR